MVAGGNCVNFDANSFQKSLEKEECTVKEFVTQPDKARNAKIMCPKALKIFFNRLKACGTPINLIDCNKKIKDIASDVAYLGKMVADSNGEAFDAAGFQKSLEKEECTVKEFLTQPDKAINTKTLMSSTVQIGVYKYFPNCETPPAYDVKELNKITADMGSL